MRLIAIFLLLIGCEKDPGHASFTQKKAASPDQTSNDTTAPKPPRLSKLDYDCRAQSDIPRIECLALIALYEATGGDNWQNNNGWATLSPMQWYGVGVKDRYVASLWLKANSLGGVLPSEIGNLRKLRVLDLSNNDIGGMIPEELGRLSELRLLDLERNHLQGAVPPELGELVGLIYFGLGDNRLSGPIPNKLGDLSVLSILRLQDNRLTGPIPAELGDLRGLSSLHLHNNRLSGALPQELKQLDSVEMILCRNHFSGTPTDVVDWLKDRHVVWGAACQ